MIQKHLIGAINGCWPFEGLRIAWLISSPATKASKLSGRRSSKCLLVDMEIQVG